MKLWSSKPGCCTYLQPDCQARSWKFLPRSVCFCWIIGPARNGTGDLTRTRPSICCRAVPGIFHGFTGGVQSAGGSGGVLSGEREMEDQVIQSPHPMGVFNWMQTRWTTVGSTLIQSISRLPGIPEPKTLGRKARVRDPNTADRDLTGSQDASHPEQPLRVLQVFEHLEQQGLAQRCVRLPARRGQQVGNSESRLRSRVVWWGALGSKSGR